MNQPFAPARSGDDFRARFSTAEFRDIFDAAMLQDIRLELVDGELARMTPPMGSHSSRQGAVFGALWGLIGHRAMVEAAVDLGDGTVLVCDAAVLHAPMSEHRFLRPDELLLAIEIAETTLDRDLGVKRSRYAAAGIPHYWVIDAQRRVIHRFTEPTDGEYLALASLRFGEALPVPGTDGTILLD